MTDSIDCFLDLLIATTTLRCPSHCLRIRKPRRAAAASFGFVNTTSANFCICVAGSHASNKSTSSFTVFGDGSLMSTLLVMTSFVLSTTKVLLLPTKKLGTAVNTPSSQLAFRGISERNGDDGQAIAHKGLKSEVGTA